MITLKIKYQTENNSRILEYIKNYNSVFNCLFNHFQKENKVLSTKESFVFINSLNNIFIDTYFKTGALYDAKQVFNKFQNKKIIFGGKKLFLDRIKNLILHDDFKIKKLRPLQIIGASHDKGNKKFQILSDSEILFKPCRKEHFYIKIKKHWKKLSKEIKIINNCTRKM